MSESKQLNVGEPEGDLKRPYEAPMVEVMALDQVVRGTSAIPGDTARTGQN